MRVLTGARLAVVAATPLEKSVIPSFQCAGAKVVQLADLERPVCLGADVDASAACDFIISGKPLDEALKRHARRLGVPIKDFRWAVDAICNGDRPVELAPQHSVPSVLPPPSLPPPSSPLSPPRRSRRSFQGDEAATALPPSERRHSAAASGGVAAWGHTMKGSPAAVVAARIDAVLPPPTRMLRGRHSTTAASPVTNGDVPRVVSSVPLGTTALHHRDGGAAMPVTYRSGLGAGGGPGATTSHPREETTTSAPMSLSQDADELFTQEWPQLPSQQAATTTLPTSRSPPPPPVTPFELRDPVGRPPEGLNLPSTPSHTYYGSLVRDGVRIVVGDALLLPAATGESRQRVARLQAMWSELTCAGEVHHLCRCHRYHHPQDTQFPSTGSPTEVFASNLIEPRVPVADVQGPCHVIHGPQGDAAPIAALASCKDRPSIFRCHYHYDHEHIRLSLAI